MQIRDPKRTYAEAFSRDIPTLLGFLIRGVVCDRYPYPNFCLCAFLGAVVLGHFQWVVTVLGALQKAYIPCRSLIEALYTLNSPPKP